MAYTLFERLRNSWNAFLSREPTGHFNIYESGYGSTNPPFRSRSYRGGDKSLVTAVFGRIAVDCASINIEHVRVDENGNFSITLPFFVWRTGSCTLFR